MWDGVCRVGYCTVWYRVGCVLDCCLYRWVWPGCVCSGVVWCVGYLCQCVHVGGMRVRGVVIMGGGYGRSVGRMWVFGGRE